jgi:hypothetical protein
MSQDNFDKSLRDIIGDMSGEDHSEAMRRKEEIWAKVNPQKEQERRRLPWLWILLALLGGAIGTYLAMSSSSTATEQDMLMATAIEVDDVADDVADDRSQQIATLMLKLDQQSRMVDSILLLNTDLSQQVASLQNAKGSLASESATPIVQMVTDTVYLVEAQEPQAPVIRLVRDTVFLVDTVLLEGLAPAQYEQPLVEVPQDVIEGSVDASDDLKANRPSSIQFNFSASNSNIK